MLEVADNGLGIKQEHQHKLFSMFKRLHTHVEGTGIGLYIVKRIIENNGGRLHVESKHGVGTTFRVYFKPLTSARIVAPNQQNGSANARHVASGTPTWKK